MKEKTILPVLHFCCMLATVAALDCSKQEETQEQVSKCFIDQGIQLPTPDSSGSGQWLTETWLEDTFIKHSSEICQKKGAYQNTVNCFANIVSQCTHEEHKVFLPPNDFIGHVVDPFCDEKSKGELECVKKQFEQILKCSEAAGQLHKGQCEVFSKHVDCHSKALKDCGCQAFRAFEMIIVGIFHPPDCPKETDRQLVACEVVGETHPSTGGGGQLSDHFAVYLVGSLGWIAFEFFVN